LADRTASAGERCDAPREPGHERVQVGVGQGPVDPAVQFGLVGAEVVRAENRLHGPAPSQQPGQVLHAARARGRADADLDLSQDGVLPCGEPHVAGQQQRGNLELDPGARRPSKSLVSSWLAGRGRKNR
jgi:hypothetical protein